MGSSWSGPNRFDYPTTACLCSVHSVCPMPDRCGCECHTDVASSSLADRGEAGVVRGDDGAPGSRQCAIEGCSRRARTRGWCETHYSSWRLYGDPLATARWRENRPSAADRFWAKVDKQGPNGCWLWTGRTIRGYGKVVGPFDPVRGRNRSVIAHRFAYELEVGPIPEGLQIDHLCRVLACVNPEHLEPVTNRENTLRAYTAMGSDQACRNGHPRTPENIRIDRKGKRICRACGRARSLAFLSRKRQQSVAPGVKPFASPRQGRSSLRPAPWRPFGKKRGTVVQTVPRASGGLISRTGTE